MFVRKKFLCPVGESEIFLSQHTSSKTLSSLKSNELHHPPVSRNIVSGVIELRVPDATSRSAQFNCDAPTPPESNVQAGNTLPATQQPASCCPVLLWRRPIGFVWGAAVALPQLLLEQQGQCKSSLMLKQWGDTTARWGSTTLVAAPLGVCSQPKGPGATKSQCAGSANMSAPFPTCHNCQIGEPDVIWSLVSGSQSEFVTDLAIGTWHELHEGVLNVPTVIGNCLAFVFVVGDVTLFLLHPMCTDLTCCCILCTHHSFKQLTTWQSTIPFRLPDVDMKLGSAVPPRVVDLVCFSNGMITPPPFPPLQKLLSKWEGGTRTCVSGSGKCFSLPGELTLENSNSD